MPQVKYTDYTSVNQVTLTPKPMKSGKYSYTLIPSRYKYAGIGEGENFLFELGKLRANRGIVVSTSTSGEKEFYKINGVFVGDTINSQLNFLDQVWRKAVSDAFTEGYFENDAVTLDQALKKIRPFAFRPGKDKIPDPTAPMITSMKLDVDQSGNVRTIFVEPDGTPNGRIIPWQELKDMTIEFIPCIQFKGIYMGNGMQVQFVLKSAIITSKNSPGAEFNQGATLASLGGTSATTALNEVTAPVVLPPVPDVSMQTLTSNVPDRMAMPAIPDRTAMVMPTVPQVAQSLPFIPQVTQPLPPLSDSQPQLYQMPTLPQ